MIPSNSMTISGDISKQLLGLTTQHIHFLAENTKGQTKAPSKPTIGIHQHMLTAFTALSLSAKEVGIELKIASGFRSFERQLHIWNNKFTGITEIKKANGESVDISCLSDWEIIEAILLYSALPGASRHHWGCDIDVYAPNLLPAGKSLQLEPWEYQPSGPMAKLSTWLSQHAADFGFYLPYDIYRGGIAEEPWHLSFAALSQQYQANFDTQTLLTCLNNSDIAGKETIIDNLDEISKRYINNINTKI